MCGPMIGLVGGLVSAMGAVAQANAQANAANANAAYQQRQAQIERDKAAYEAARLQDRADNLFGRQLALYGAAGVEPEGSPSEVIIDTVDQTQLDIQAVKYGGEINASNYEYRAAISRMQAADARGAAVFGALTPIVNSFTRLSGSGGGFNFSYGYG